MTIEAGNRAGRKLRRALGVIAGVVLVLAAWTALVAALTLGAAPGTKVAIVGPVERSIAAITAAGGRLVQANGYAVVAQFDEPGFVPRLYSAGALLVVDAQGGGCSGFARSLTAAMRL
jgi:hypothetical protein